MGNNRVDFTAKTKQWLCSSVCGHCSICGDCTTWVDIDENTEKKVNIGEAAHIKAASVGGPRYDPNQTDKDRASFGNGIWVCKTCHTKIDSNEDFYTVSFLRTRKAIAMKVARQNINESIQGNGRVGRLDFTRAMASFFSQLYRSHERLHKTIKILKESVDDLFCVDSSEGLFITEYCLGNPDFIEKIRKIKNDVWGDNTMFICKSLKKGGLYISDDIFHLEERYFEIIGACPSEASKWWAFFNRIKEKYAELEDINTKVLEEYKKQFKMYIKDI